MQYFVFGAQPTLSLAEMLRQGIRVRHEDAFPTHAITQADTLDASELIDRLAGTVKIGEVIGNGNVDNQEQLIEMMASAIQRPGSGKLHVGLSIYAPDAKRWLEWRERLGLSLKKRLKEGGGVRFVSAKEPELSSVVIRTNKLLTHGSEFCIFVHDDGKTVTIGRTDAVQDFSAWSDRDFGRPARDARSGMLPPKLARMMVNLAGARVDGQVLLDPFCGSGTVLMEAALRGYARVIGTDFSSQAIKDSESNLHWLETDKSVELAVADATKLTETVTEQVDAIVTETFLGTPAGKDVTRAHLEAQIPDLMRMYRQAFGEIHAVLKPDATAVVAFPIFRLGERWRALELRAMLEEIGFSIIPSFENPPSWAEMTDNGGLLYARADQRVGRDILVLMHS